MFMVLGMTLHILSTPDVMAKVIYPVIYLQDNVQCSYEPLKLDLMSSSHSLAMHSLPTITAIELDALSFPIPFQPLYLQTGKSISSG